MGTKTHYRVSLTAVLMSSRLVLMSATADFKRYEEYFSELGREERVERIYISNLAATVQSYLLQTKVKYLENVSCVASSSPGF